MSTRVALAAMAALLAAAGGAAPAHAVSIDAVEAKAAHVDRTITRLEAVASRYGTWQRCLTGVPVSEDGDPDARGPGFAYDERDGTGVGPRSALAPGPAHSADFTFFAFARRAGCRTRHTEPGGTADSARAVPASAAGMPRSAAPAAPLAERVRALETRVAALRQRLTRVRRAAKRFDAWESCVSQLPITRFGDPGGDFGFLTGPMRAGLAPHYRSAIAIDRTDWDDPDYRFLALRRGDRPGRDCDSDPGEASD